MPYLHLVSQASRKELEVKDRLSCDLETRTPLPELMEGAAFQEDGMWSRGRVLSTTSLSIGKGLQAHVVEERGEQANRETLAHGRQVVRMGSPGRGLLCCKGAGVGARRAALKPAVC